MLFEFELLRRLPKYQQDDLIDELSAQKLKTHLQGKVATSKIIFKIGLYLIGIAFIATSLSLFIANIWDGLSIDTRLELSFLPLILSGFVGLFVLFKDANKFFRELSATLIVSTFVLMLILVTRTTNLYNSLFDFYLVCIIATLPIMFIYKSEVASMAIIVFLACLVWQEIDYSSFIFSILFSGSLAVFMGLYILRDYKNADFLRVFSCYVFFIVGWVILNGLLWHLFKDLDFTNREDNCIYFFINMGLGCLLIFSENFKCFSKIAINIKPFFITAIVVLSMSCFSINSSKQFSRTFENSLDSFDKLLSFNFSSIILLLAIVFICVTWCILFYKTVKDLKNNYPIAIGSLMLPCIVLAILFNGEGYYGFMILASLIYFFTAMSFSVKGIWQKSFVFMNLGVIMIIVFIVNRAILADVHIVTRAVFFAICGVLLIGSNFYLNRKKEI